MKYQVNVLHQSGWDTSYFTTLAGAKEYYVNSILAFPDKVHTLEQVKTIKTYTGPKHN